jgi:glycosyltransferase involved in cell wall biosynthesis
MHSVTVIIPTLALRERADLIQRAVGSVLSQEGVRATPLLIVNGDRHDAELVRSLRADPRVKIVRRAEKGIPLALKAGRALVTSPWFGSLDDDDLLLPGALATRVDALAQHPEIDVVVSNGFKCGTYGDTLLIQDVAAVRRDPLGTLLEGNWLLPGSWLCRTDIAPADLFEKMPRHLECTYLAVRFATSGRMLFLAEPMIKWSATTPDSAAKSPEYRAGHVAGLKQILELPLPRSFRAGLRRKLSAAYHRVSGDCLAAGRIRDAWRWHLASLVEKGGTRYLPYTRRLVMARWAGPR